MLVEHTCTPRALVLTAVASDAFDGATRLLGDAERFGFRVSLFHLDARGEREASIRMTLLIPPEADASHIRCRLARHGSVISIEAA